MSLSRDEMLDQLSALPRAEFEEMVFRARIEAIIPGRDAPQRERAIEVIRYFESREDSWVELINLIAGVKKNSSSRGKQQKSQTISTTSKPPSDKFEYDVFLSHSSADKATVRELAERLKGDGLRVWFDEWVIQPGDSIPLAIERGLENSRTLVLVMSQAAFDSEWVTLEQHTALFRDPTNQQRRFIPLRLDDCDIKGLLKLFAYVDWRKRDEEEYAKLLASCWDRPFQAATAPGWFVGRDAEIRNAMKILKSPGALLVIRGLGGVGKTTLASKLAIDVQNEFPDGVLWARMEGGDVSSILGSLISAFGETHRKTLNHLATLESRRAYYEHILSTRRCLIVLDNVKSADEVNALRPSRSASALLVTTRLALGGVLDDVHELEVAAFTDRETEQLLGQLLPDCEIADDCLKTFCELLGNLPLAIRVAAGVMKHLGWTLREYLCRLDESNVLDWVSNDELSEGVRASFAIGYAQLSDSHKRLFRTIAIFPTPSIEPALLAHLFEIPLAQIERMLLSLSRRGLIDGDTSFLGGFCIHTLMHAYARELLNDAEESVLAHTIAGDYFRRQISRWDESAGMFSFSRLGSNEDTTHGIAAVFHYFEVGSLQSSQDVLVAIADVLEHQRRESELLSWISRLKRVTALDPWLQLYEAGLNGPRNIEGRRFPAMDGLKELAKSEDKKLASAALIGISKHYLANNEYERAEACLRNSWNLKAEMQPEDWRGVAFIQNELARLQLLRGHDPTVALSLYENALDLQTMHSDTSGRAYTLGKIAAIYIHRLHDIERAENTLRTAELLSREAGNNVFLVRILLMKSEIARRKQDYRAASKLLEEAKQEAAEIGDPSSLADVLRHMAHLFESVELFGAARQCLAELADLSFALAGRKKERTERLLARIEARMNALRNELAEVCQEIESLQNSLEVGATRNQSVRSQLRLASRRAKRVKQKLGTIPGQIRLGKRAK